MTGGALSPLDGGVPCLRTLQAARLPLSRTKRVPIIAASETVRPRPVLGRWSDRLPAAGALLHIRVVPSRIRTIVPGVWGRFDIHPGRWSDDAWRRDIQVPVRGPVRPERHHNVWPNEAMAPMRAAVPAMPPMRAAVKAMATMRAAVKAMASLPTPLCVPWGRARHEQPHQEPHQHQPRLSCARGPVSVTHCTPLSRHSMLPPRTDALCRDLVCEATSNGGGLLCVCTHCTRESPSSATAGYRAIASPAPG
jgi:hypothetical protein